jgi:hypothetical protein
MKDCKWNPPTAGTKGIHVSPDGEILDRTALNDVEESTVLLKLIESSGKPKVRRAAARQIEQWRKDGTLARFISGELDPPGNWVRHVRWRELDTTNGSSSGRASNATGKVITGEDLVPRAVDALFLDAYEGGYYNDSPLYAEDYDATRSAVLRAALTSLMREGRLKREELLELNKRTTSFDEALHNAKVINRAFALHPSPTTATELAVRHGSFLLQLDPNKPDDVKKAELLCHARTSFDKPSWASLVSPLEVLDHASNSRNPAVMLAAITTRLQSISQSAGSLMRNFNTLGTGERAHAQQREALELLSVLYDPVDQRALAVVIATAATYASGVPSGLASTAPHLPDGVSDLDRLTRAVAAGLKDGRIHGDPEHAAKLALDVLAGKDIAPGATITKEQDWKFGTLGTLSTGALMSGAGKDATVAEILRHPVTSLTHWDTIVLSKNPDPREVLTAIALRQARRNGGEYDAMALGRADAIAREQQSLRTIASTAVAQATNNARSEDVSATLALALVSDAKHNRPSAELLSALDSFTATGITPVVRDPHNLPATTAISALMSEARAHAAGAPASARPSLPPQTEKLYAQLRASVGHDVGCVAEVYPGAHGPHFEQALHVPFADDVNVPALIAHISESLANAPRKRERGLLVTSEVPSSRPAFPASIGIRSNELLITHDSSIDAHRAVLESLAAHNGNPRSELLLQPRASIDPAMAPPVPANRLDPEFERILAEDEEIGRRSRGNRGTPTRPDRTFAEDGEVDPAMAPPVPANRLDPEFERILAEDEGFERILRDGE